MATGQGTGRPQRRMGPAPFASLEDLSDEADSSPSETVDRLPGIHEDTAAASPEPPSLKPSGGVTGGGGGGVGPATATGGGGLTPGTPRIDISRASSSSHHEDSRDSTPERELFEGPGGKGCTRLGLAFTEEGALELRSSTEELDFQDERTRAEHQQQQQQQQRATRPRTHSQPRKDSQGSDIGLLSISGRTSRLSSVGSSQGSGGRVSDASRLSVASGASRSPSPHKMLLETSFCGSRTCLAGDVGAALTAPSATASPELETETELLERVLLSRRQDPTEAVLAEGISIECRRKIEPAPPVPLETCVPDSERSSAHSSPLPTPGKTIVSDSGVEYTFIPLKGPLPTGLDSRPLVPQPKVQPASKARTSEPKRSSSPKASSGAVPATSSEPQYIRIKLKPDHMYADTNHCGPPPVQKPDSLDLTDVRMPESRTVVRATPAPSARCTPSPVSRKNSFVSLFRGSASPDSPSTRKRLSLTADGSRSRSKSSDRVGQGTSSRAAATTNKPNHHRSVFALFKPKKAATSREPSPPPATQPANAAGLSGLAFSFRREQPLEGDSIIIPLHSPSEKREPLQLAGSDIEPPKSVELEGTVTTHKPGTDTTKQQTPDHDTGTHANDIRLVKDSKHFDKVRPKLVSDVHKSREGAKHQVEAGVVRLAQQQQQQHPEHVESECRRSSTTSSDNVVFSTKLGMDNDEVFTTKLPKHELVAASALAPGPVSTPTPTPTPIPAPAATSPHAQPSPQPSLVDVADSSEQESEDKVPVADGSDGSSSEHERKGLVMQQDSFEDELPYVPTTLPQERSVAVPMVPIKQRASCEVRTCPIERPRSTTPINPAGGLDAYQPRTADSAPPASKLKISLPWDESGRRSPGRRSTGAAVPPPPLPPRSAPPLTDWVNFDDIPERRKPPKRIQTIPSRAALALGQPLADENVVYSYVNPEDCKCECHETGTRAGGAPAAPDKREDELPLLMTAERRSDSSLESQPGAAAAPPPPPPPPPPKRMGAGGRPRAPS